MCPLVLGAVAGVTECLLTARMLAQVWLFTRVAPQVNLEILKPGKGLLATFKRALVGLLPGVDSHVDEQFIPGVEWLVPSRTAGPEASEVFPFALVYVNLLDVPHKFLLLVIQGAAVDPATAVFAPNVLHLPVLLQGLLGKGQRLGPGH